MISSKENISVKIILENTKKLIFDIIEARIQELFEIFIKKNLNIESFTKEKFPIFFLIKDNLNIDLFKDIFLKQFLKGNEQNISFIEEPSIEQFYENVNNIVQFGWKKEAIPITQNKQSIITRFFKSFFG